MSKNGYAPLPTVDPEEIPSDRTKYHKARGLRPGLFYMFGDRGRYVVGHSDSEEIEMREMKPKRPKQYKRIRSPKSPKTPKTKMKLDVIVEPILPGDTVQRVALRYSCPDSEIRRVNNLYRDQDFFALKTVKIPVREYSVLTEPQELEQRRKNVVEGNQSSSTSDEMRLGGPGTYYRSDEEYSCDADDEKGDSDGPEYRDISIQSALKWKYSRHTLLQKFDEELQRVREDTENRMSNMKEVALTLNSPAIQPIVTKDSYEKRLFLWHLDWRVMIGGFIVFIIVVVVSAVVYTIHLKKK